MSNTKKDAASHDIDDTMQIPVVSADEKEGDSVPAAKNVKLKAVKKLPKWVKIVGIVGIVLVIAIVFSLLKSGGKSKTTAKGSDYTVSKRDIALTISGSGSVAAIDQYDVIPLARGEILSCSIEEGSQVNKGDVLYTIDSSDAQTNIDRAVNSLEKAQMAYDDALENMEKLSVKSPIDGIITAVYVKEGDNVANNGKIMDVTDRSTMILKLPFIVTDANLIRVGDSATVTIEGLYYTMTGTVTRVSSGTSVSSEGVEVKTVEIAVKNPGSLTASSSATAIIGSVACHSAGYFENNEIKTIYAKSSGEVTYQPFEVGDAVKKGEAVLSISEKDAAKALKNAKISLSDAQLALDNARKILEDYTITAPISGRVIKKNSKAGDNLDNSNSTTTMCTIADLSKIVFEMNVDELDISKIKVGMEATITADAIENRTFSGVVDYVSSLGTTSNGVTSYPVKVQILDPDDLVIGMNVDAEIIVDERMDVLSVPVNAVKRGNIVYRKKTGNTASGNQGVPTGGAQGSQGATGNMPAAGGNTRGGKNMIGESVPEGYEAVKVELGLNNDAFIEVTSGLSEGDIIWVEIVETQSTNMLFPMGGMGGGMGGPPSGMGGGMPGGGMR